MGFLLPIRWSVVPAVVRSPSAPSLKTAITDILVAEAVAKARALSSSQRIGPAHYDDRYLAVSDSGDYPIVPAGKGLPANIDITQHLSMLEEVERVLEAAKKRMSGVTNVAMTLKLKEPGLVARFQDLLLGIPLKQHISQQPRARNWHILLEETAAVLHILGRRLYLEGEYRAALDFLNRSLGHYLSLDVGLYEGWIQGVQANIRDLPSQVSGERKIRIPFTLTAALEAYRREFMTESGRYSFAPPSHPVEDIFGPPDFRNVQGLQREIVSSPSSLPAIPVVRNVFEEEWEKLSWGRRLLLSRPLYRLRAAENQSAMEILSQMTWWMRKKSMNPIMMEKMIGKAIHVLDVFLNRSPRDTVAQIVVEGFPITHPHYVRRQEEFIFYDAIEGVDVYYIDLTLK